MYHGSPPDSKGRIRSTYRYSWGLTGQNIRCQIVKGADEVVEIRKQRFSGGNTPLSRLANARFKKSEAEHGEASVNSLELVLYTQTLQEFEGNDSAKVHSEHTDNLTGAIIENQYALYKLKQRSPELTEIELLTLLQKGLENDAPVRHFKYFEFEKALDELVKVMVTALQDADSDCTPSKQNTTMDRARQVVWEVGDLATSKAGSNRNEKYHIRVEALHNVFTKWLVQKGAIGSSHLREQGSKSLKPLRSDLAHHIQEVADRARFQMTG